MPQVAGQRRVAVDRGVVAIARTVRQFSSVLRNAQETVLNLGVDDPLPAGCRGIRAPCS